eukprot:1578068-Ditylum_brightwellii.AAC.1
MKEGLDRSKAMQNCTHYVLEIRLNQIDQYSILEKHDLDSTKEDLLCTAMASESLARKSPTIPPPFIESEIAKTNKSKTTDIMPGVLEEQNGTTTNRSFDVSMMQKHYAKITCNSQRVELPGMMMTTSARTKRNDRLMMKMKKQMLTQMQMIF